MQTSIKFYDSDLDCHISDYIRPIELRRAYVHRWEIINGEWIGSGYVQDVKIKINTASAPQKRPTVSEIISDSMLSVGNMLFDNLMPAPFKMNGLICSMLQFSTSMSKLFLSLIRKKAMNTSSR